MGDLAGASYHPMRIYTDQDGEMIDYEPKPVTGFSGEFESFHQAIRQDLPSPVPAEEVLMTAKIFDAIYESSRIGRSVPIA
jgi:predicted dehydrogenase